MYVSKAIDTLKLLLAYSDQLTGIPSELNIVGRIRESLYSSDSSIVQVCVINSNPRAVACVIHSLKQLDQGFTTVSGNKEFDDLDLFYDMEGKRLNISVVNESTVTDGWVQTDGSPATLQYAR